MCLGEDLQVGLLFQGVLLRNKPSCQVPGNSVWVYEGDFSLFPFQLCVVNSSPVLPEGEGVMKVKGVQVE